LEKLNSYIGMAENDYLYAKNGLEFCEQLGNYNPVVSGCAQAAEKYLKAIVEVFYPMADETTELLRTHNLRKLCDAVTDVCKFNVSSKDCKWLGDFYFDARYPGDNFMKVQKKDGFEAIRLLEEIRKNTFEVLDEKKKQREDIYGKLREFKAFDDTV